MRTTLPRGRTYSAAYWKGFSLRATKGTVWGPVPSGVAACTSLTTSWNLKKSTYDSAPCLVVISFFSSPSFILDKLQTPSNPCKPLFLRIKPEQLHRAECHVGFVPRVRPLRCSTVEKFCRSCILITKPLHTMTHRLADRSHRQSKIYLATSNLHQFSEFIRQYCHILTLTPARSPTLTSSTKPP